MKTVSKNQGRIRRHARIRSHLTGTALRPRLSVHRSLLGMFAQLIDDVSGKTIVSAHTKTDVKKGATAPDRSGKVAMSYVLGQVLAEKAKAKGITSVVFDRSGYQYHGRVQAIADGARDGGLQF